MKRSISCFYLMALFTTMVSAVAAMNAKPSRNDKIQNMGSGSVNAQPSGEEVFKSNCSRCHAPPMSLSPGVTGTVIMHMRVRARLSRGDEQLLLRYLAP